MRTKKRLILGFLVFTDVFEIFDFNATDVNFIVNYCRGMSDTFYDSTTQVSFERAIVRPKKSLGVNKMVRWMRHVQRNMLINSALKFASQPFRSILWLFCLRAIILIVTNKFGRMFVFWFFCCGDHRARDFYERPTNIRAWSGCAYLEKLVLFAGTVNDS